MLAGSAVARAEEIEAYFPSGVSGYDQELGVTVRSRLRPLFEAPGVEVGGMVVHPALDQSLFYNSNVNGSARSGSLGSHTSASVTADSDWTRHSLDLALGTDRYQYFALPGESYTDWNAGLAGGYTIGDNQLSLSYAHQTYHQLGTAIGTTRSVAPALNRTDSARASYTFTLSSLEVTPDLSASLYRYGTAMLSQAVRLSQAYLNRNVVAGGLLTRYLLSDEGSVLLIARALQSSYVNPLPGAPSNDSTTFLLLAGLDYQAEDLWRGQLLAGEEVRVFKAPAFGSRSAPVVEGNVIWSPTPLTTVTGTATRRIEFPESPGSTGFILNKAQLVLDHELDINILVQARAGFQLAQYLQGGTQTNVTAGAGLTWLLNRNMRIAINYDYTTQSSITAGGTTSSAGLTSGRFVQSLASVTLHIGL